MINQVVSSNIASGNAFKDFSQAQNAYYLNMPLENDNKKNKSYGKTIVVSSLLAGFGILALMKGAIPKSLSKILDKWKLKLEEKTAKGGRLKNFYHFIIGKINSFRAKAESINNFTSMKDVLFQRLMWGKKGNRTFTRKIHEGITRFFDKISRNTVNSAYSSTQKKFASLNEYMSVMNERILRDYPNNPKIAKAIKDIEARMSSVNSNLDKGFGINARNARLKQMNEAYEDLFEYFWNASVKDIKNFRSKNMYQSYIAEDYLLPAKMKLANDTSTLRQLITHDIADNYKATMEAVDNIQKFVSPNDMPTNEALNTLRNCLTKYKKLSGKNEAAQREQLNKEIVETLQKLSQSFEGNSRYSSEAVADITKYISNMRDIISKGASKGELQEILTLYKGILPRKEYLKLRAEVQSSIKSLDKAIDIETVQYFDKARDLKLGSAPTDILSILATVGAVGWYLGKAENKDERISASLKYGIPAVGAIATSLYCTARLVSGGKSIALGLLSGWIMNIVGAKVDDARKKYALDVDFHSRKPQPDKV